MLAAATVVLATPLGGALSPTWRASATRRLAAVSSEWRPAFQSPLAIAYVGVAAGFAGRLWLRARGSRSPTPVLVAAAFLALALVSLRNIIFVGPVIALAIASLAPDRQVRMPWPLVGALVAASAGAAATWAIAVGPARNEPILDARLIDYAVRHPPPSGHIASYAGIGSYMLWRSPRAPVELDGWLEHFSAAELRGTYAVLDGRLANPTPLRAPPADRRRDRRPRGRDPRPAPPRLPGRLPDPRRGLPGQANGRRRRPRRPGRGPGCAAAC